MKEYFPAFFKSFSLFEELMEKGSAKGQFTDVTLKVEDNLFGTKNLIINDREYPILSEDDRQTVWHEVYLHLFNILKEEEKYHLFHLMDIDEIREYECFQKLLKEEEYHSPFIENGYIINIGVYDEDDDKLLAHELWNADWDSLRVEFQLEDDYEIFTLTDWKRDKNLKLRVLFDKSEDPNMIPADDLCEYFIAEEGRIAAKNHHLVSDRYSEYEYGVIAYKIKTHEYFVPEELNEIGYLNSDDEYRNRMEAIENFIAELEDNEKIGINDHYVDGSSGGYLVLDIIRLTKEKIFKIAEKIESEKEKHIKYYQNLANYKHDFHHILEYIEEKKEEIDEKKADELKNKILKMQKERS